MNSVINWVKGVIERSWQNNKKIHKKALKKSENRWRLFVAMLILVLFSWALIPDEPKMGLSFLFAGSMAIYAGYIYKGEMVMGYVLAGVVFATVIPLLLPGISEAYKNADYVGMLILILLGVFIWYLSSRLKKGEFPDFGEKPVKERRPRR
jgi:uncharacterized integral membrane protein